jgi:hypothetical protein
VTAGDAQSLLGCGSGYPKPTSAVALCIIGDATADGDATAEAVQTISSQIANLSTTLPPKDGHQRLYPRALDA